MTPQPAPATEAKKSVERMVCKENKGVYWRVVRHIRIMLHNKGTQGKNVGKILYIKKSLHYTTVQRIPPQHY